MHPVDHSWGAGGMGVKLVPGVPGGERLGDTPRCCTVAVVCFAPQAGWSAEEAQK